MRVLIVATHWPGAPARFLARGFRAAGHEVFTSGPHIRGEWKPNADYIVPTDLDLIITADHKVYWKYGADVPHILVAQDGASYNDEMYSFRDSVNFDYEFYIDPADLKGRPNAYWLPGAYDPELHTPGPDWDARPIPAALYGSLDGGRQDVVDVVRQVCDVATGYVEPEQYAMAYQNTKISICHSRLGYLDNRFFESMAMGCAVVSDYKRGTAELCAFQGVIPCLWYSNSTAARDMVSFLLSHPERSQFMTGEAFKWVRPHTWQARAEQIIQTVFEGKE